MASLLLTPKSTVHGKITPNLPTSDVVDNIVTFNVFQEVTLGGTLSPAVLLDDFVIIRLQGKVASGTGKWRVTKTDGVTVLGTFVPSPISNTSFVKLLTAVIKVTDVADWVDIKIQTTNGNQSVDNTTKQDSIEIFRAESRNSTDVNGVKRHVNSIFFFSGGTSEGIGGLLSDKADDDFTELVLNEIMSSFIWSANSGNTIYSWSGLGVGVSV